MSSSIPIQMEAYRCPRCSGEGWNGIDGIECLMCDGTGFRPENPSKAMRRWVEYHDEVNLSVAGMIARDASSKQNSESSHGISSSVAENKKDLA